MMKSLSLKAVVPVVLFYFTTCSVKVVEGQVEWNYTDQEAWKSVEEFFCDGMHQSPVNIETDKLVRNRSFLINLKLTNFNKNFSGNWTNGGSTVRFLFAADSDTALFQNHLGIYQVVNFHFHWGPNRMLGSEHQVDGQPFSGEIHMVTVTTDGDIAVLSVFLVSDANLPVTGTWSILNNAIPAQYQESIGVDGIQLTDLLPNDLNYYHYTGSQTSPPCREIPVQFFILRNPLKVPATFLESLRTEVIGRNNEILSMNFRYPNPLNGRLVMIPDTNGASSRFNSFSAVFSAIVTIAIYGILQH